MSNDKSIGSTGQIAFNDALFGFIIFLVVYVTLANIWFTKFSSVDSFRSLTGMQLLALKTSETLVKTSGDPVNWETVVRKVGVTCENENLVGVIGLATAGNTLKTEKVLQFVDCITYERSVFLMKLERFDYNFTLKAANGAVFTKGVPLTQQKEAVSINRFVDFNGFDANLSLTLIEK